MLPAWDEESNSYNDLRLFPTDVKVNCEVLSFPIKSKFPGGSFSDPNSDPGEVHINWIKRLDSGDLVPRYFISARNSHHQMDKIWNKAFKIQELIYDGQHDWQEEEEE